MLERATTTEILAAIIGLYLVVVGIGAVFERDVYQRLVTEFRSNLALGYLTGIMAFIVGAAIVVLHNDWSSALAIVVSAVGWIALVKGALILAFRRPFLAAVGWLRLGQRFALVAGLVSILLGGALVYCAFAG